MTPLATINAMDMRAFVQAFGNVAEHSPWVAKAAATARPFASRGAMITAFETALRSAPDDMQLLLIRAHPDLAGKARLTANSQNEQKGAGLDALSPDEFTTFTQLNAAYIERFGFPFIFAVKGATKHQVLESFKERIQNTRDDEFAMALTQVMRIFRFRIEDLVLQ